MKFSLRYFEHAGERFGFRESGSGAPAICLHSGIPGATGEGDFAANLESLSAQHRVVLVDLPAFGRFASARAASVLIGDLLAHLQIARTSIIGNGFGGEVALNLAADSPEAVERLVLIDPTGCLFSPFTPVPMEGLKAVERYWEQPSPGTMANVLRLLAIDPASEVEAEALARHSAAVSEPIRPELDSADLRDPLHVAPLVKAPTLLIWGREDRFTPLDFGLSLLSRIPDARFHLLPRCGHNAQRDSAVEVNALLRDFLGDQP